MDTTSPVPVANRVQCGASQLQKCIMQSAPCEGGATPMEALMACCDESDDSDAVQPASRAQASVRRPRLWSGKSAAEPGEVDKLSGIRIEYRHTHKDAIVALHRSGYIFTWESRRSLSLTGPALARQRGRTPAAIRTGSPRRCLCVRCCLNSPAPVVQTPTPCGSSPTCAPAASPSASSSSAQRTALTITRWLGEVFVIIDAKRLAPPKVGVEQLRTRSHRVKATARETRGRGSTEAAEVRHNTQTETV